MVITTPKCNSATGLRAYTQMRVFKNACEYFLKQGFDRYDAERYAQACMRQLRRGLNGKSQDEIADHILSKANLEYIIYATGDVL